MVATLLLAALSCAVWIAFMTWGDVRKDFGSRVMNLGKGGQP